MTGCYYPYWSHDIQGHKYKSPLFDSYSNMILKLKNREVSAIKYFYNILEPLANKQIVIVVVPSHDPCNTISGIHDVAKLMCKNNLWIDGTNCLKRTIKIPKLASGGSRSIQVHKDSIQVANAEVIRGRSVFLLDDVTTTGNSFIACRLLLNKAGAMSIETHALGQTYLRR